MRSAQACGQLSIYVKIVKIADTLQTSQLPHRWATFGINASIHCLRNQGQETAFVGERTGDGFVD